MRMRIRWLLLSLLVAIGLLGTVWQATAVTTHLSILNTNKLNPPLQKALTQLASDETIRVIIYLAPTANLTRETLPNDKIARRTAVVEQLQSVANVSQTQLRSQLNQMQATGAVGAYHPFWIINGIAAEATAVAITQLATHPDVNHITLDEAHHYFDNTMATRNNVPTEFPWGINRIAAPFVWYGLGVDGQGVTVAIMDTGTDWQHPALRDNYRGLQADGSVDHGASWFHTSIFTSTEPFDWHGHGTHVAGTAVGRQGIGVAPGAKWIAVAIADQNGIIFDSNVHAGFEWLMAPNGDPALAPDVINNSWTGSGERTEFLPDVLAIRAAGIIPVFAAGNFGPDTGTVGSPASYPQTIAIGATDDQDDMAWFSSRGPSPLTEEPKPLLVAPGTAVYSAIPDGKFAHFNGTSMATPHAVGAIALLLSANPTLTEPQIINLLSDTAVAIDPPHPNNNSGAGLINSYAAVETQVATGLLQGTVRHNGLPLPHVAISLTVPGGQTLSLSSDDDGWFHMPLLPGRYQLETAPFGYVGQHLTNIQVDSEATTTQHFDLLQLPHGIVKGFVQDEDGYPLLATISAHGTPVTTLSDANGRYTLNLPAGSATLLVEKPGYRLQTASLNLAANQHQAIDFRLQSGPKIMLVDQGHLRYDNSATYYEQALHDNLYGYAKWTIQTPLNSLPSADDLAEIDVLIWSSPKGSPGAIQANDVLTDYLATGGTLLISGQNVGQLDGNGEGTQPWWRHDLGASYVGNNIIEDETAVAINGAPNTLFSGINFHLNGADSADNQTDPDHAEPGRGTLAQTIFKFNDGQSAGLQAGQCKPHRIVYLGFGLEGVAEAQNRSAILGRSLDSLQLPRVVTGGQWMPEAINDVVLPGSQISYTITLQNFSETLTDTFSLAITDQGWQSQIVSPTLTLGPCGQKQTTLLLTVPNSLEHDSSTEILVMGSSANDPHTQVKLPINLKTPGDILLVDDERYYNRESEYMAALEQLSLSYDVWETGNDLEGRGSPPKTMLQAYETVIWTTGYDWHDPITPEENELLRTYLAGNGRLFLSSQDFLSKHGNSALARNDFGVVTYQESVSSTVAFAAQSIAPSGAWAGPQPLTFAPYQNFSDGLITQSGIESFLWHDGGLGGIANSPTSGGRTVFWGVPFETLPSESQPAALESILGWLSDLGDSGLSSDQRTVEVGETVAFTLTVKNATTAPTNRVIVTNELPNGLEIIPSTISNHAAYDSRARQLTWQGSLPPGGSHLIRYEAVVQSGASFVSQLDNKVSFVLPSEGHLVKKQVSLWVNAPDLSSSAVTAVADQLLPHQNITYTLTLHNNGSVSTNGAAVDLRLSELVQVVTETLHTTAGKVELVEQQLQWAGDLAPGASVTTSVVVSRTLLLDEWLTATAVVNDGLTEPFIRHNVTHLPPYQSFLPVAAMGRKVIGQ